MVYNADFEDGTISPFVELTSGLTTSTDSFSGTYSLYKSSDGGNDPDAEWVFDSQGNEVERVTFYWKETSSQQNAAIGFIDTNGNEVAWVGTDNPGVKCSDGSGNSTKFMDPNEYNVWIKIVATFDWNNNEITFEAYDQSDSDSGSITVPMETANPVAKLEIAGLRYYDSNSPDANPRDMWFDDFVIEEGTNNVTSTSSPATATATPTQSSNSGSATSSSTPSAATATPTQSSNTGSATSSSSPAQAQGVPVQSSNFGSATSTSQPATATATPQVSSVNVIAAPLVEKRKPRIDVTLIESESGEEHKIISTEDGSDNFLQGDLTIDGSVKSAVDGFNFTLSNPGNRFDFISADDEIVIKMGYNTPLTTVMRGLVTKPQTNWGNDGNKMKIEGEDFGQRLQKRVAAEVYLNEGIGDIIRDLIAKYAPELDTSAVQDPGITLESHRVAYQSLFNTIEDLAERADYQFFVDNTKTLHFEPVGFDDTNKVFREAELIESFSKTPNLTKTVNEAIVFGGKRDVREEETFTGDGSTSTFQTTYKPHDPDVFVNGTHLQGGAKGTQDLTEVDYVYDIDTREFDFSNTPADGENVEINYTRHIPIQAIKSDSDSIDEYGKYQRRITDQNITRKSVAESLAQSLVDDYSEPPQEIESTIIAVHSLKAGQTASFDVPSVGINTEKYDIVGITYTWGSSGYKMDLKLNEEPDDLTDIIKDMKNDVETTKGFDSGVLDLIRKIQDYSDSLNISEVLNIDNRTINDSFILGHPDAQNSELGTAQLGDRRGSWTDLIDVN